VIRVVAADDQRIVREGLALLLGLLPGVEVVGTASDGEEAVAMATELRPDVILMDLRMPRVDGVEATRRLRGTGVKVVVLTTYADDRSVLEALRAGAVGYLTKDAGAAEIRDALDLVTRGEVSLDPAAQRHLVQAVTAGSPSATGALPDGLTAREAEVLALIAEGLTNTEIAARLVVSEATVKSHINHLLPKIGARDRAQAVSYAYRAGLAHNQPDGSLSRPVPAYPGPFPLTPARSRLPRPVPAYPGPIPRPAHPVHHSTNTHPLRPAPAPDNAEVPDYAVIYPTFS
jgi:DNA-binding NarL/FixJ family response regulator